jgi:hypothetical protein
MYVKIIAFIDSFMESRQTQWASAMRTNHLTVCEEIIAAHSDKHTKYTNALWVKNTKYLC